MTAADIEATYELVPTGRKGLVQILDMNRVDLAKLFADLGYKHGAEIGVLRGAYSEVLCQENPGLHLFAVDPWAPYPGYREFTSRKRCAEFEAEARSRLAPYNVDFLPMMSVDAAVYIPKGSLDFVYIDGNHELSHVIADLTVWTPKVRKGGMVAGHDYIQRRNRPGIEPATHVVEALDAFRLSWNISPVFIVGTKEMKPEEKRDSERSWFWVVE